MTCEAFAGVVVELVRGGDLSVADEARAHASTCARCRSSLEEQRLLGRRLQSLAEETSTSETPVAVSVALQRAFREHVGRAGSGAPVQRRSSVGWLWPVAAAVLVSLAVAAWRGAGWRTDPVQVAGSPASPTVVTQPAAPSPLPTTAHGAEEPARARAVVAAPFRTRRQRAAREQEPRAVFLPLIPGDRLDDFGPGRLVRVGMPRAALVSWGWPVEGDVAAETVEADLLVGEDGVARAIRVAN